MPVELRKRKAHQQPQVSAPPPKKKSAAASKVTKVAEKVKKAVTPKAAKKEEKEEVKPKDVTPEEAAEKEEKEKPKPEAKKAGGKVAPGDAITLEGFGGEILTNDGEKTTLKELVDKSKAGVVLFTYPKASTPGCTSTP